MSIIDNFYFDKEEPNKSCLLAMRDIVLNYDKDILETKKYGMPCYCYKGKAVCYVMVEKKSNSPYYLIVEGRYINHPALEKGDRKRMKIFRINPNEDIPIDTIRLILKAALELLK